MEWRYRLETDLKNREERMNEVSSIQSSGMETK